MRRTPLKTWWILPAAMALLLAVALPGRADVQINKIVVEPSGGTATIRVKIINPAVDLQQTPISVKLSVRKNDSAKWTELVTWTDFPMLDNGDSASRTWDDASNTLVRSLVGGGSFQIKVKAVAPGLPAPVEYRQTWTAPAGP